ncbi:MAG: DUF4326 domain-containing protein [Burkholderiaceae bacterium]
MQLQRTRNWRMPPGTRVVARPTAWGNPFRVGDRVEGWGIVKSRAEAVELYRQRVTAPPPGHSYEELRGLNLACWCPLDEPCHADVLLERARLTTSRTLP